MRNENPRKRLAKDAFAPENPPPLTFAHTIKDLTTKSYKNVNNSFLLARTFRAGASNGIEVELAYLQNMPGYIFVNPTTVISYKIASKTISQLPGNKWSGQPSLLFSIQVDKQATIAHYGLASLNSFSSTDAIVLMFRKQSLQAKINKQVLPVKPLAMKLRELQQYLQEHWLDIIDELKQEQAQSEGKQAKPNPAKEKKRFGKSYELYFHTRRDYNELISSFQEFIDLLEDANHLDKATTDVALKRHPLAELIAEAQDLQPIKAKMLGEEITRSSSLNGSRNKRNKLKRLFFQAEGALKEQLNSTPISQVSAAHDIDIATVYERYANYLETGARHNELVSRVYPWEITGIEWGGDEETQIKAISDLIIVRECKRRLLREFNVQEFQHPLFIDFMMNKLSLENAHLDYDDLQKLVQRKMSSDIRELNTIMDEIKEQLENPVEIYEYSPKSRVLFNISELVAKPLDKRERHYQKQQQCKKIISEGEEAYQLKLAETIIIPPLSKIKKLAVRVNKTELEQWAKFWQLPEDAAEKVKLKVLQQLSERIINQPYIDDPRELKDSHNNVIYRPNHDVMHSMRKVHYLPYLIQLISASKAQPWATVINKFTVEERACLELVVFLYRAGRTNEQGGSADPSNAERSAALFELIAKQLGFREELITCMKYCFDFVSLEDQHQLACLGYSGAHQEQQQKALLAFRLASISHAMDLVRTNSWRSFFRTKDEFLQAKKLNPELKNFKFELVDQLRLFFPNEPESQVDDLLLLAKKSCEATGTIVHCDQFSAETKVSDYELPMQDKALIELLEQESLSNKIGLVLATETHAGGLLLRDVKSFFTGHLVECARVLNRVGGIVNDELKQQRELRKQDKLRPLLSWLNSQGAGPVKQAQVQEHDKLDVPEAIFSCRI